MPSADFPPGNSLSFERGSPSLTAPCGIARSRKMSLRVGSMRWRMRPCAIYARAAAVIGETPCQPRVLALVIASFRKMSSDWRTSLITCYAKTRGIPPYTSRGLVASGLFGLVCTTEHLPWSMKRMSCGSGSAHTRHIRQTRRPGVASNFEKDCWRTTRKRGMMMEPEARVGAV